MNTNENKFDWSKVTEKEEAKYKNHFNQVNRNIVKSIESEPGRMKSIADTLKDTKLDKKDIAYIVFRASMMGGTIGKWCGSFGFSTSYYRDLKTKHIEWDDKARSYDDEAFRTIAEVFFTSGLSYEDYCVWRCKVFYAQLLDTPIETPQQLKLSVASSYIS